MIPFLWMETRWNWYMYIKDRYKNGELYPMKLDIFHFYGWKPNMYNYVYIKIYHTDYGEKFNHSRCIQQLLPVKSSCKSCRSTGSSKSKPRLPTAEMPGPPVFTRRFSMGVLISYWNLSIWYFKRGNGEPWFFRKWWTFFWTNRMTLAARSNITISLFISCLMSVKSSKNRSIFVGVPSGKLT